MEPQVKTELKRDTCNTTTTTASANWILSGDAPQLRGPLTQD